MEQAIKWFDDRKGKVTYSMTSRLGPNSYDCSSAVYLALKAAGIFPASIWTGNTDSLFNDLEKRGFSRVPEVNGNIATKRGDVFIWGKRGASTGAFGHTGIFVNANDIIHCNYGYNGITVNNHDVIHRANGYPDNTIYRYTGASAPVVTNAVDQVVEVGSYIKFADILIADDVQFVGGMWQVRSNVLCREGFTWDDNGIPAEPLVEVDADGYRTPDQVLDLGSRYKLPGKYYVHDVGQSGSRWLALIDYNGLKFWVDIETATEVSSSDGGTPVPGNRPAKPAPVVEPPKVEPPVTIPPTPLPPAPQHEEPVQVLTPEPVETPQLPVPIPVKNNPVKEKKPMAFTQEQQTKIALQQQQVLDANGEFTPVISDRVKTVAYFTTDAAAILSTLVLTIAGVLGYMDAIVALTINGAVVAALLGLKQTFRLSSKK